MGYKFVDKVDQTLLDSTVKTWKKQISEDPENTSSSYYEARLGYCNGAFTGQTFGNGHGALCAVVEDGTDFASAFIIVTYAKDKHLKMLDVYVQPDLNVANREPNVPALAWLAATAIIGCLNMIFTDFPCNELKVLAGWPLDKEFLTAITTALMTEPNLGSKFEVTTHGNWIVLAKKAIVEA